MVKIKDCIGVFFM